MKNKPEEIQDPMVVDAAELMNPIDMAAATLLPMEAEPVVPPIEMGAEAGQTLIGPGGAPIMTDADYFGALGSEAANLFNPNILAEQVQNMSGAQFPTDPYTGQPLPSAPLPDMAAAEGAAVISPETQLLAQKTGDVSTTTVDPTAGAMGALQGARNAVAAGDAARAAEVEIVGQLAEEKAIIDAERGAAAQDYASKAQILYDQAEKDLQTNRDEIARLRQQYASQPWQSYWGSKETGDKIMLGLAVGLGALSQSQIGGQNLAMAFIQSGIDDHNKSQDARFRNLEAQLTSAQAGSVQGQQAIKLQFENLVATKAAAYDHLDKQLAAISAKTNVQAARNNAEKLRADLGLKANKELFEMENELSARTTTRSDIFSSRTVKGSPLSFVRADGQPMTEAQSKEYKAFLTTAPALKDMETLESQLVNTTEYANYRKALLNEMRDLPTIEGLVNGAAILARFDSMVERSNAGNAGLQMYDRALRKIMVDKLRLDSGASIAPSEYSQFIKTYMPKDITSNNDPASQAMDLEQVRKYRRDYLNAMLGASGSASKPWYMEGKK
jgi:hypothetical protein